MAITKKPNIYTEAFNAMLAEVSIPETSGYLSVSSSDIGFAAVALRSATINDVAAFDISGVLSSLFSMGRNTELDRLGNGIQISTDTRLCFNYTISDGDGDTYQGYAVNGAYQWGYDTLFPYKTESDIQEPIFLTTAKILRTYAGRPTSVAVIIPREWDIKTYGVQVYSGGDAFTPAGVYSAIWRGGDAATPPSSVQLVVKGGDALPLVSIYTPPTDKDSHHLVITIWGEYNGPIILRSQFSSVEVVLNCTSHPEPECAQLLRWVNTLGGYDQLMFSAGSTDSLVVTSRRIASVSDGRAVAIGASAARELTLRAPLLDKEEFYFAQGILVSPRIELYDTSSDSWVPVVITADTTTPWQSRERRQQLEVAITLPSLITQF